MPLCLKLQTKVDERSLETRARAGQNRPPPARPHSLRGARARGSRERARARAGQNRDPRSRKLCGALEIEYSKRDRQIDMIPRFKVKARRLARSLDLLIGGFVAANRRALVRKVGNGHQ